MMNLNFEKMHQNLLPTKLANSSAKEERVKLGIDRKSKIFSLLFERYEFNINTPIFLKLNYCIGKNIFWSILRSFYLLGKNLNWQNHSLLSTNYILETTIQIILVCFFF